METKIKRQRKAFNKVVRSLSELYGMPYIEVLKVYQRQERNISATKMILNLTQLQAS